MKYWNDSATDSTSIYASGGQKPYSLQVIGAGEKTKKNKTTFIKPPLIGRGCQPLSGLPKTFY
jgi:hypothetical protein